MVELKDLLGIIGLISAIIFHSSHASFIKASVDFEKLFVNLNVRAGVLSGPHTCKAEDAYPKGSFEWAIGDQIMENSNEVQEVDTDYYTQAFTFTPELAMNGKDFTCRYTQENPDTGRIETSEAVLSLRVWMLDLPESPLNLGSFAPGSKVELSVNFSASPKPMAEHLKWFINSTRINNEGFLTRELGLGEVEPEATYESSGLRSLGGNDYKVSLTFSNASAEDASKEIYLSIKHPLGGQKESRIRLQFEVTEENLKDKSMAQQTGVGIWIILAIVLLVLIICVVYCIYQKKCNKSPSRPDYKAAAGSEEEANEESQKPKT